MNKTYQVQLISKKEIKSDRYELTFTRPSEFIFEPGQYIWVQVPLKHTTDSYDRHAFSICTLPSDSTIQIIFHDTGSAYKKTLLELTAQELVTIHGPFGSRKFPSDPSKPVVCVAGGMGVAPFLSLIKNEFLQKTNRSILLIYANHDKEHIIYEEELNALQRENSNFQITYVFGHISKEAFPHEITTNTEWYVSGPRGMCSQTDQILKELGVNEPMIHFEEFYPTSGNEIDISKDMNIF